jgi:hypothetical protein
MSWGRRRDSDLRLRVQVLESRARLSLQALSALRTRLIELTEAMMPIIELSDLLGRITNIEALLYGGGEGGAS